MAGRITSGPNVADVNDNFSASFVTATDGKPALAVVNTDGTTIGGGGGGGGTQYAEGVTTSPATGTLALGRYQTSLPTLTNGQMNEPQLDSSSRLLVNVASSSVTNQSTNLTQVAGSAIALGQATASASLPVVQALPSTGANNQATVPTGTSTALGSNAMTQGFIVKALSTNTVPIYVGFSGTTVANGHELVPGESTSFAVNNTNLIYSISGTASQKLCFVGS